MRSCIVILVCALLGALAEEIIEQDIDERIDIFPPKNKPGEVIGKTEHSNIDAALGEVLKAATIMQTRNIAIGLASTNGRLVNPRFFLKDGVQPATLPPVIETGETGLILFSKSTIGVKGVYGSVTYDIEGTELRVALMFSIPFNHVLYANKFNMKIYPNTVPVDGKLVNQMYEFAGPWIPGGYEKRSEFGVDFTGSMTENRNAKLIVWSDATNYDLAKGPSRYADCAYRTIVLGYRCWVECDIGACWTAESCEQVTDCHAKMPCNTDCEYYEVDPEIKE